MLRLPIPFASRLSRFDHGCLKRGYRDRREHSERSMWQKKQNKTKTKQKKKDKIKSFILWKQ